MDSSCQTFELFDIFRFKYKQKMSLNIKKV